MNIRLIIIRVLIVLVSVLLVVFCVFLYEYGIQKENARWVKNCTYGQRMVNYEQGFANVYNCKLIAIDELKVIE